MKIWSYLLLLIIGMLVSLALFEDNAGALKSDVDPCRPIQIVFARGSGIDLNVREAAYFTRQLLDRLSPEGIMAGNYELGSEKQGSYQYPAKAIAGSTAALVRGLGAQLSGGLGYEYGASVNEGVEELKVYLSKRSSKCPATKFVLGGYSQGAQVMGQALPGLPQDILNRVIYVALFGDPKLYLPEGEGINPPACRQ